jgi:hypothetical protein
VGEVGDDVGVMRQEPVPVEAGVAPVGVEDGGAVEVEAGGVGVVDDGDVPVVGVDDVAGVFEGGGDHRALPTGVVERDPHGALIS